MVRDPGWIVFVLSDLHRFAAENCRPEVALHLAAAKVHILPYISENPPTAHSDPGVQTAQDVVEALMKFSKAQGMEEARLHLLAARRKILHHAEPDSGGPSVIRFPNLEDEI